MVAFSGSIHYACCCQLFKVWGSGCWRSCAGCWSRLLSSVGLYAETLNPQREHGAGNVEGLYYVSHRQTP